RITIKDTVAVDYEKLGDDLKNIYDYGLAEAAKNYALFVKIGYLTGNPMAKQTGELFKSVKFLRTTNQPDLSYTVMPGVNIRGHLNYLNRYVKTEKEFMAPSFKAWKDRKTINQILESNFEKIAKQKGLLQ
ncbi:MAG: hypothetical protein ACOWWR_07835, partial [Eubacteriales bacterium]